jgi:ADP-heptose:LPS heptosyltransferase
VLPASSPGKMPPLASFRSVLVVRPDRLGDFVVTLPALRAIARNLSPDCKLTVLCGTRGETLARLYFENVQVVRKNLISFILCAVKIHGRYDLVIDLHSHPFSMTSGLLTLSTRSPHRVGFTETEFTTSPLASRIYNHGLVFKNDAAHETEKMNRLAEFAGASGFDEVGEGWLRPRLPESSIERARAFLSASGAAHRPMVGIHPTLSSRYTWTMERFAQFARLATGQLGIGIVVVHGRGEEKRLLEFQSIGRDIEGVSYYPYNSVPEILALCSGLKTVVCNDSGIMHLCSIATSVVAIFGGSVVSRWRPIGAPGSICLQKPDRNCMSITSRDVIETVRLFL